MNITLSIFYFYALLTVFSAIMVIIAVNPIHSVLFLILVFLNVASLLILLESDFLGITLIIVYVGAIAILFLFVVMMLNIKIVLSNFSLLRYLPIGGIILLLFLIEFYIIIDSDLIPIFTINNNSILFTDWITQLYSLTNIQAIGLILYTYYADLFVISGFILLIAMLGAIILTLRINPEIKKQIVFKQVYPK